ncbi:potassium channel family protein [Streptacidiphilus sp. PAMC 29251]
MRTPLPRIPLPGFSGRAWWGWVLAAAGFVALVAGYFTLPMDAFGPAHPILSWMVFICALALLGGLLLRQIQLVLAESDRGRPAVSIVLLICLSLVIFAAAYLALSRQQGQFSGLRTRTDALYFTVVTMATIGYGDISPSGQEARLVVLVQVLYNFVFLAAGASALTRRLRVKATDRIQARQGSHGHDHGHDHGRDHGHGSAAGPLLGSDHDS